MNPLNNYASKVDQSLLVDASQPRTTEQPQTSSYANTASDVVIELSASTLEWTFEIATSIFDAQ